METSSSGYWKMESSAKQELLTEAITANELISQLGRLLVTPERGIVLEVHCSLKSIGYIVGGAQTLVDALIKSLGHDGTLVMPFQCGDNTEPAFWQLPPLDRSLWEKIRQNMPAYSPQSSEPRGMSEAYMNLSRRAGCYASNHPTSSFLAYGKYGKLITNKQDLDFPLGEESPLSTMYELPSYILLIGVGYDNCTAMHLGECRSNTRPVILQGSAINENGYRRWKKYLDYDMDSSIFPEIGKKMEDDGLVSKGFLGHSLCRIFRFRDAVDYARDFFIEREG